MCCSSSVSLLFAVIIPQPMVHLYGPGTCNLIVRHGCFASAVGQLGRDETRPKRTPLFRLSHQTYMAWRTRWREQNDIPSANQPPTHHHPQPQTVRLPEPHRAASHLQVPCSSAAARSAGQARAATGLSLEWVRQRQAPPPWFWARWSGGGATVGRCRLTSQVLRSAAQAPWATQSCCAGWALLPTRRSSHHPTTTTPPPCHCHCRCYPSFRLPPSLRYLLSWAV